MKYPALEPFLDRMIERKASDLFLSVGCAPHLRVDDKLVPFEMPPLDASDIAVLVHELLNESQRDEFKASLEMSLAIVKENGERFRVSLFQQMHTMGMVIRHIKSVIPTTKELGLSSIYENIIMQKRGLVLLVGPTGAGKSTSMAAMLEYRNRNGSGHIIMIEDPVEFVFEHKGCIFTQREIGIDTYSYSLALKNALRQSPDVIVIGEIRDRETLESAILFCETGHLVLATLHGSNSTQAIERMLHFFPEENHKQVLVTLSQTLKAILSQRLVETTDGSRMLASEILINEGLVRQLIEEGQISNIKMVIEKSGSGGMQSFDQALYSLLQQGKITHDVALMEADNPNNLRLKIAQDRGASAASGILGEFPGSVFMGSRLEERSDNAGNPPVF